MENDTFERIVMETFGPAIDDFFYSKIAGGNYKNADGTYRSRTISECRVLELLDFEPEPDNPFDVHATKVLRRETGEHLGYLPSRTAMDLAARYEPGKMWLGLLKEHTMNPQTGLIAGANIMVLCWNQERYLAHLEAIRPKSKEERFEAVRRAREERLRGNNI